MGTFTPEGTFNTIIPHLDELKEVGVTAIQLMPVVQFPGNRNWGYDGVFPFAPQNSYGGPEGLKRLVNACHRRGLAAVLDVVYNHLGPEGNYLGKFGPYFTERYQGPWGPAPNFDGSYSDEVRHYFIENALYWLTEFHFDALRLDAIHGIFDMSAYPFLAELPEAVQQRATQLNRRICLIPESDLNDIRAIQPPELGGYGLDAQWNDDFHHALHALLTGERHGYYQDFGRLDQLAKAFTEGFVYSGEYSTFRQRRHGSSTRSIPAHQFVVFAQNHDQVGNRTQGERLSQLVPFEALKLAAGVVLLSPFIPLLFLGEEYGETGPFLCFVSHSDPNLIETVQKGRKEEFASFDCSDDPSDPQEEATFLRSKLHHELKQQGEHRTLRALYKELLRLRRELSALARLSKEEIKVTGYEKEKALVLRRGRQGEQVVAVFHFGGDQTAIALPFPTGLWAKHLDSADPQWGGRGSSLPSELEAEGNISLTLNPKAFVLYVQAEEARS